MPENAIIAEIHRKREEVARECEFDPVKLIAYYRRRELERADDGHPLVKQPISESDSPAVREEPPAQ
jgi:hypothetical protein